MADLASVTENFFSVASETFTDNLSSSISAGAGTVPVNNATEYAQGDVVVLTVDPGTVNEATFIGVKDTGNQFIDCIWTEGNVAVGHDAGATIIDYDSATHHYAQTKGILQFANQQGGLLTQAVRDALSLGTQAVNGWEVFPHAVQVSSGYNKGRGYYDITVPNQDVTSLLSVGNKMRFERSVAAPTQCADFDNALSQYASLGSPSGYGSITDDITIEAWIYYEPLTTPQAMGIFSRRTASTGGSGFSLRVDANGFPVILGLASGNFRAWTSNTAIPSNQWVHIAATLDMSGNTSATNKIYINGTEVTCSLSSSGSPTSFTQSGTLNICGEFGNNNRFHGKISDVRFWSVVRSATEIADNMNQALTGSETNLAGYWNLNGTFNDSTANANNLSGSGGAVATDLNNPFSDLEYADISTVTFSSPDTTLRVFTKSANVIPNMALNAVYYSTNQSPYGYPSRNTLIDNVHNRYKAGAYATGTTIPTSSWAKIRLDNVYLDSNKDFDTVNYRYVASVSGWYQINAQAAVGDAGIDTTGNAYAGLRINGSEVVQTQAIRGSGSNLVLPIPTISCLRYLSAGDYVELWGFNGDPTTPRGVASGIRKTFMDIHLVSME